MIANDNQLKAAQERIHHFLAQIAHLRNVEADPLSYRLSASGFLAEVDRMQLVYQLNRPTAPSLNRT